MSFLDRLFRKADKPFSKLDEFVAMIHRNEIHARAKEAKVRELRTATAISLLVLEQSGRFARDLFAALRAAPIRSSSTNRGAPSFDAAVFETAAFVDYVLLAEHLGSSDAFDADDTDENNDEGEIGSYVAAVRHAHHLTTAIVNSLVSFQVNEEIFENRPIAYAMRARGQGLVEMFEGLLIGAIESGGPAVLRRGCVSLELQLPIVVGIHARTFIATSLPALEEVARNVVDHAAELGFE